MRKFLIIGFIFSSLAFARGNNNEKSGLPVDTTCKVTKTVGKNDQRVVSVSSCPGSYVPSKPAKGKNS